MIRLISLTITACAFLCTNVVLAGASTLEVDMLTCAKLIKSDTRLACYDSLANSLQTVPKIKYIQPSKQFLDSSLVTTPWVTDFSLTINGFVDLISRAVAENNKKIIINGWTRQDQLYVLSIDMGVPVELKFQQHSIDAATPAMSLLKAPLYKGQTMNAELFVFTIASMVPDKKEKSSTQMNNP